MRRGAVEGETDRRVETSVLDRHSSWTLGKPVALRLRLYTDLSVVSLSLFFFQAHSLPSDLERRTTRWGSRAACCTGVGSQLPCFVVLEGLTFSHLERRLANVTA